MEKTFGPYPVLSSRHDMLLEIYAIAAGITDYKVNVPENSNAKPLKSFEALIEALQKIKVTDETPKNNVREVRMSDLKMKENLKPKIVIPKKVEIISNESVTAMDVKDLILSYGTFESGLRESDMSTPAIPFINSPKMSGFRFCD